MQIGEILRPNEIGEILDQASWSCVTGWEIDKGLIYSYSAMDISADAEIPEGAATASNYVMALKNDFNSCGAYANTKLFDNNGVNKTVTDTLIADILHNEYDDFLEFCLNADKKYSSELVGADYVAFRSQYGITRERIAQLRRLIESHEAPTALAPITNDNSVASKATDINSDKGCTADNNLLPINSAAATVVSDYSDGFFDCQQNEVVATELVHSSESTEFDNFELVLGTNNPSVPNSLSNENELPLYQYFSVDWKQYADLSIKEADFGNRVCHSLFRGWTHRGFTCSIKTVGDLLQLSLHQLSTFNRMGSLSLERILSTLEQIVHSECDKNEMMCPTTILHKSENIQHENTYQAKDLPVSTESCKQELLSMLRGECYDTTRLSETESAKFSECISACETIGAELALAAAQGHRSIFDIVQMFRNYYESHQKLYEQKTKLDHAFGLLPADTKKLLVAPFIFAYHTSVDMDNICWSVSLDSDATLADFKNAIMNDAVNAEANLSFAVPFIEWLNFDVTTLCQPIIDCLKRQRDNAQFVFNQRILGGTLDTVGGTIGLTRERIRQIEKKVSDAILREYWKQRKEYDVLALIYALQKGSSILSFDVVSSYIAEDAAQILWYFAKRDRINRKAVYYFSHKLNAIVFGNESDLVALSSLDSILPEFIEKSEMVHYIAELASKLRVTEEILNIQWNSIYKLDGKLYHRGRLTVVFMCDYILRTRFPNGYKIVDETEHKRFLSYLYEVFGEKGALTTRALDAKIGQIGVLINRGKYIHPFYIDVDKKIIDDINAYIEESPRVVLTYTELFDTFSDRLKGTQINNRYCLQGVLKLLGCPFIMRKDYITKETGANLASEFEHFVEQSGRVHLSVLLEEFNGLTEINISFFCQQLSTIVVLNDGYYIHSSQLKIYENDYNQQREFLLAACSGTPSSTRALYNEYMMRFTDFMIRNNIESQGNLFGVLQYMFRKEFFFSRPYISLNNDTDLTHHSVLLQHLSGANSIEIEDLTAICDKNGIHFLSVRSMIESLEPDFIRVGKTMLMRKKLAGLDDDSVLDAAQQIKELVHVRGGYCASKNIDDFSWFPELNIPWNAYLLESVAALAGDLLTVLRINTSTIYTPVDVYIGDEFVEEDTNSLILRLLLKESQLEHFASKEDVFYWLQEQGLCNAKLPSFLETEGHLFYDESGKLQVH